MHFILSWFIEVNVLLCINPDLYLYLLDSTNTKTEPTNYWKWILGGVVIVGGMSIG